MRQIGEPINRLDALHLGRLFELERYMLTVLARVSLHYAAVVDSEGSIEERRQLPLIPDLLPATLGLAGRVCFFAIGWSHIREYRLDISFFGPFWSLPILQMEAWHPSR